MKSSLNTIQQTLTPEASAFLAAAAEAAGRRNHGQTTPLHMAAALLSSPSSILRQACLHSHSLSSSHPLKSRALDLCFSVALDRLPAAAPPPSPPPLSNALTAALKRAQARRRHGVGVGVGHQLPPPPMLAAKVELEQLIVSILDDPSVSRIMREARFSSPAVKAAVEHSFSFSHSLSSHPQPMHTYLNPRLQNRSSGPCSPFSEMFSRLDGDSINNGSIDSFTPMKTFQNPNPLIRNSNLCPQCTENYEQELAKLVTNEYEKSSSEAKSEPARPPLPQWLVNAKSDKDAKLNLIVSQAKDQEILFKQKTQELQKKWSDKCLRMHSNFRPMTVYNPKPLTRQPLQQKLQPNKALGKSLQLNSPPRSPVTTDLFLGRPKNNNEKNRVMDLLGCVSSEFQVEKFAKAIDTDSYKRLLDGLKEKVWWQKEAGSKVASIVTNGKVGQSKGDMWLLFAGPDRVGKKKMAYVISDRIYGNNPIIISLGRRRSDEEKLMNFRGKTVLDKIVEAIRKNPFSVIMLDDIDEADMLIKGSIKRAMEMGRITDSYGREFSLGKVIFILTTNWSPVNFNKLDSDQILDENENTYRDISSGGWQLRLCVREKNTKRKGDWVHDQERLVKPRRVSSSTLSLDLNLTADFEDDPTDRSPNSSGLTVDHDDDLIQRFSITSVPIELVDFVGNAVVFKPVETDFVRNEIRNKISEKYLDVVDDVSLELEREALEKILRGVWFGQTGLEEWSENVLLPSFRKLKTTLPSSDQNIIVRLEIDSDSGMRSSGDWLPSSIRV